jgi:biopolymer transport protein ExbB/TolQ
MSKDRILRVLDWRRQDIENRIGFPAAKYTDTNAVLTFLLAAVLWLFLHGVMVILPPEYRRTQWVAIFLDRGPTPFATMFAFLWAVAILWIKSAKLAFQKRALRLMIVPHSHEFILTPNTAREILDRMRAIVDDPKRFILLNRIERSLANLHNIGNISDVSEMLRAQAENDEDHMESSYAMVRGFIWCIPILGFIGTVLGLSVAIGSFGNVLSAGQGMEDVKGALSSVTGGLSVAFDTTLLALVAALIAQLIMTGLKKKEELFLDDCKEYCHSQIVSRLRLTTRTEGADLPEKTADEHPETTEQG